MPHRWYPDNRSVWNGNVYAVSGPLRFVNKFYAYLLFIKRNKTACSNTKQRAFSLGASPEYFF